MYPPETTIAEKFHAIVVRGMLNSRMKDYYDIWALCHERAFDGTILAKAIAATFRRRKTELPGDTPLGLSDEFASDITKRTQWAAFVRRTPLRTVEEDLSDVVTVIRNFLIPPSLAALGSSFACNWRPNGPWMEA